MSYNPQQPLHLPQLPKNSEQSDQLLLAREPQDQLIDFGEIGGYLREKNDELGNSLEFGPHQNHLEANQMHFQQQHTNERNYEHQQQINDHHENKYVHSHAENNHKRYNYQEQQQQQELDNRSAQRKLSLQPRRKCICKKTQCLKMYCQCFASNLPCTEQCTCLSCKNTLQHQKEIEEAKLLIQQKGVVGLHSCSLSEKRCNCKKSGCLKKYCECYNSGVKCSEGCKCVGCQNCQNPKYQNDEKPQGTVKVAKVKKEKAKPVKANEVKGKN